jgi:hypothetical protein
MSERKYCTRCGAQVRSGNAFCVSCGARLDAASRVPEHTKAGAVPPRPTAFGAKDMFGTLMRQAKASPRPPGVVVALATLGLLMVLLVVLFPLVSPLLEFVGQAILLVPLLVFAISVFGVLFEVGWAERRRLLRRVGLISLSVYVFFATYRVLLGVLGLVEGGSPAWLLVLVAGCGLVYIAFVIRNRGENAGPVLPALAGEGWLATLGGVLRWVNSLPWIVKAAVVVGVLGTLIMFSPYVFVLGAALVGASVLALIVRAVRHMPLKQAGVVAAASLAVTLAFGGISDALYNTGTGLEMSVSTGQNEASGTDTGVAGTSGEAKYGSDAADEAPAGYGDDLPELQREIETYLGDRLLDVDIEETFAGAGAYIVSVNFLYEGSIEEAHYGIQRDVAYVYYLIYAGEYGPYISEVQVTASRTQGKPVYITRMLPEQGAYMQATKGDPQFTHGYYEVLLKDPALPY